MSGWRRGSVGREAVRHLTGATVRTLLVGAVFAGGFFALVWAELDVTSGLLEQAERLRSRGGDVVVIEAVDDVFPAGACTALEARPVVIAAGAVGRTDVVRFSSSPSVTFEIVEATPGALRVWDPGVPLPVNGGWIVGAAAAGELGVVTGSMLAAVGDIPRPVTVVEPGDRNPFAARWVIQVMPPSTDVALCWVEFSPDAVSGGRAMLAASFAPTEVNIRSVIVVDGEFAADPAADLASRPQRLAWLPVGGMFALVAAILGWIRRSETAVYRAYGLPSSGAVLLYQVELGLLATAAFAIACAWAVALHVVSGGVPALDQIGISVRTAAKALLFFLTLAPLLVASTSRGNPAILLKDRG